MEEYFKALRSNMEEGVRDPDARELMAALDAAYRATIGKPHPGPALFGRFLQVCHKSMLAAYALIAQRQPEDSVAVTRRAVEAAKVALAIKANSANANEWLSFEHRNNRWITRQRGERPKSFRVKYDDLGGNPVADELDLWLGVLSDAYVHFTPEYFDSLDWDEKICADGERQIFLHYFHRGAQEVERHFKLLSAAHGTIFKAFDQCFDGGISADPEMIDAVNRFWQTAKRFSDDYHERYGSGSQAAPSA